MNKTSDIIYGIIYKDSKELFSNRAYPTIGRARAAFAHKHDSHKSNLAIAEFKFDRIVEDGVELKKKQDAVKNERIRKEKILSIEYKIDRLQIEKEKLTKTNFDDEIQQLNKELELLKSQ